MKLTLEFDMEKEEDQYEWEQIYEPAPKNSRAVEELFNWIRSKTKYDPKLTRSQAKMLDELREHIVGYLNE